MKNARCGLPDLETLQDVRQTMDFDELMTLVRTSRKKRRAKKRQLRNWQRKRRYVVGIIILNLNDKLPQILMVIIKVS